MAGKRSVLKKILYVVLLLFVVCAVIFIKLTYSSYLRAKSITQSKCLLGAVGDVVVEVKDEVELDKCIKNNFPQIAAGNGLLVRSETGEFLDVWENPISIHVRKAGNAFYCKVASSGQDGVKNTNDDVVYRQTIINVSSGHKNETVEKVR